MGSERQRRDQIDRFRRRHGRAHVVGWSALILCIILGKRAGFRQGTNASHNMILAWWEQGCSGWDGTDSTRAAPWRPTGSRECLHDNHPGHRGRIVRVADGGIPSQGQAEHSRVLLRRGCRAGGHYARCGFVSATARLIGVAAGLVPFFACYKMKAGLAMTTRRHVRDSRCRRTLGAFLTGVFASPAVNGNLNTLLADVVGKSFGLNSESHRADARYRHHRHTVIAYVVKR